MAREFDREATVYVWDYHRDGAFGHAALKLTGVNGAEKEYISWWPDGVANQQNAFQRTWGMDGISYKHDMYKEVRPDTQGRLRLGKDRGGFDPLPNQRIVRSTGVGDDQKNYYGKQADRVIKLPGRGAIPTGGGGPVAFGLDLNKIHAWWQVFKTCPHPTYQLASRTKSFAGVIAAALRVGGADQFAPPPTALLYLDPNQIAKWARKVEAKLAKRNANAQAIHQDVMGVGEGDGAPVNEVMTVDEWMQLSRQNMGRSTARSERVQQIDAQLQAYHRYIWMTPPIKLRILGGLMDMIHLYLGKKAGSKRGDAMIALGRQVLAVAKARCAQYLNDQGVQDMEHWTVRPTPEIWD